MPSYYDLEVEVVRYVRDGGGGYYNGVREGAELNSNTSHWLQSVSSQLPCCALGV